MKTCLLYGFILAVSAALVTLVIYFLGLHSDPAKMGMSRGVSGLLILVIGVTCTALGVKARREQVPPSEEFGYGSALGAGALISLFAGIFGAVFNFVYFAYINTGFPEVMLQYQLDKLQDKGLTGARLDQAEKMTRMFMTPLPMAIFALIEGLIFGILISLVVAAFLKRPAPAGPPLVA
jgi:hypothetical protein